MRSIFTLLENNSPSAKFYPCLRLHFTEAFNSLIRAKNVHSNHLAPSRDIAVKFEVISSLRILCSGGTVDGGLRYEL